MNGPTEVKSCNIAWPAMGCAKAAAACRTSATNRAVVGFKGYNRRTNAAFHALGTLPPDRRKAHVQRSIASFVARQHMTKHVLFWTRLGRRCQRTFGLDADACKAIADALEADHGRRVIGSAAHADREGDP